MEDIVDEISSDETFCLNEINEAKKINLISCSKIPRNSKKGKIKIICFIDEEANDGNLSLILNEGKKINDIEPLVSGYIIFSQDGPTHEDLDKDEETSVPKKRSNIHYQKLNTILLFLVYLLF